jgi:hypothetical protein
MADDARRRGAGQGASTTEDAVSELGASEVDLLFALVRARYGSRLTAEQLEAVRTGVAAVVEGARALRAVRLDNADGPLLPVPPDVPPAP